MRLNCFFVLSRAAVGSNAGVVGDAFGRLARVGLLRGLGVDGMFMPSVSLPTHRKRRRQHRHTLRHSAPALCIFFAIQPEKT